MEKQLNLEALLNGRSVLELKGTEAALACDLLTQAVQNKPLESFTEIEYKALVEELAEMLALNVFKGDVSDAWKQELLNKLENSTERKWGWSWASILDIYLQGIEMWDNLGTEGRDKVTKKIMDYLKEEE
jgi:hypothetical protein